MSRKAVVLIGGDEMTMPGQAFSFAFCYRGVNLEPSPS
ncbi:hypothetical protein ATN83_0853 [Raoultella ornithinolytica]|nr:hypothetical protein ATN83_0853 [Raoultella ornithinolytica]KDV91791.1 hypothetical protein AB00_4020 [Raoultella ornithinolytica 2-156-04_S1_C1]KDX12003.1 hypothetical protein AB28_4021 [Raoultella ornithinolytica 2-156-04_S1_C2]